MIKFADDVIDRIHDVINFISNIFILWKARTTNFADIIKIATIFTETTLKDSKKLKEIEVMYQNAISICIS